MARGARSEESCRNRPTASVGQSNRHRAGKGTAVFTERATRLSPGDSNPQRPHLYRFDYQRRLATLVPFAREMEAEFTDAALTIFDKMIGGVFCPLSDSPSNIPASIEQITFRKIAQDGGPAWIPPETVLSDSQLIESLGWFAEPTRTRTIRPGVTQTVPQFVVREIQDARRFRGDRNRAKRILDNAYPIDPAHPLIHLALAMVEDDKQTAAFLRDYDLKRLPESCGYTKDLDPKEVLKLAAEMCAEP